MKALLVLAVVILLATPSWTEAFMDDPDDGCDLAALSLHAWHEWGHDLATVAVGDNPLRPGALWGDKWNEAQPGFQRIALGGLIAQILFTAIEASFDDSSARCLTVLNTSGTTAYGLRMVAFPTQSGDYDPFGSATRNRIAMTTVWTSVFLQELAAGNGHGPLFAAEAEGGTPMLLTAEEDLNGAQVARDGPPEDEDEDRLPVTLIRFGP